MKQIRGDWWPERDKVCNGVAYDFGGADKAIGFCRKTELVIQAGGCVGAWPKYLSKKFAKVYTFEPSPENFELLERNLAGSQVTAIHAALGREAGRCSIVTNPRNCGDDQTRPGDEVSVVAIDDLHLEPDLIYLDIQGDEIAALEGARETLGRCFPVVGIEYDRGLKGKPPGDTQGFLEALGYKLVKKHKQDLIFARTDP